MSFEQAYERYLNGTASEEEVAYVEEEIEKARKLSEIIDSAKPVELAEADDVSVKKAKKRFGIKSILTALVVSVVVLMVVAGAVLGGVFGTAVGSAKKSVRVGEAQAKELAINYYRNNFYIASGLDKVIVTDYEKELEYTSNLAHSYYKYEIEVKQPGGYEIEIEIDSRTGEIKIVDVEMA